MQRCTPFTSRGLSEGRGEDPSQRTTLGFSFQAFQSYGRVFEGSFERLDSSPRESDAVLVSSNRRLHDAV